MGDVHHEVVHAPGVPGGESVVCIYNVCKHNSITTNNKPASTVAPAVAPAARLPRDMRHPGTPGGAAVAVLLAAMVAMGCAVPVYVWMTTVVIPTQRRHQRSQPLASLLWLLSTLPLGKLMVILKNGLR